jgi:predicted RecA/RadA family phage recombinase
MATNEVFREADHLTLPVPSGVKSGDAVLVGSLPGVAQTTRDDVAGTATVWLDGAFRLTVTGAVANVGDPVYIVSADRSLTTTATGNTVFGYALETKTATAAPIIVRIAEV